MGILRALLWCVLLAAAGLSMASLNQPDVKYIPLEGRLELPLDTKSNTKLTTVTLWKQLSSDKQNVVAAEWVWSSPAEDKFYGTYEGRTELDKETRVIVLRNMTKEDNGVYYSVVDQKTGDYKHYNVVVIKNVPKPSVRPLCSPQSANCSLVCEGNITDSGPVTYRWRKDEGEWMDSGQNWTITNDEEWKKVEKVFCEMKNPVSEEQSDPSDNPFYIKGNTPLRGHEGIIAPLLLTVSLVLFLCVKYCVLLLKKKKEGRINNHDSTNDLIDSIIARATSLYTLSEGKGKVKGNEKQCQRLVQRVKGLEEVLVGEIKQKGAGQKSADVEKDLRDLNKTLESAKDVVKKYISDSFHEHVFKDYRDNTEFRTLNSSLNSALNKLSKALEVDCGYILETLFDEALEQAADKADRKEDHAELERIMDLIDHILDKAASLSPLCKDATCNKKQRQCLVERVKVLEERLEVIKQKGPGQKSADVEEALCELKTTLESDEVAAFVEKYTSDRAPADFGNALNKLYRALPFDQTKTNTSCSNKILDGQRMKHTSEEEEEDV